MTKKNRCNNASYSYKKSTQHGKKSHVEDDEIEIVGARHEINRNFNQLSYTYH